MFKSIIIITVIFFIGIAPIQSNIVNASAPRDNKLFDIPISKSSKQWFIEIGLPTYDKGPKNPNIFQSYGLTVKNIGENLSGVTIEAYRDEPNLTKKAIIIAPKNIGITNKGRTFQYSNFLISNEASEFEVVISWEEEGRKFKESFVFKAKGK
jgi:hypothetical protein